MEQENLRMTDEPTVPLKQLRKLTKKFKEYTEDTPITLTMVLVALFPTVWDNIKDYATECYAKGYIQGQKDAQNEN